MRPRLAEHDQIPETDLQRLQRLRAEGRLTEAQYEGQKRQLEQQEHGRPAVTNSRPPAGNGFAFWDGQTFVGLGMVGLVIAAILFFTQSGPFEEEPCIVTATAGKLCGDDARTWCDVSDPLRSLDPAASTESQGVCDEIR